MATLRELGKSTVIYGISSSLSKFIGVFLVPIFTRVFSPEEYGKIDLLDTIISLLSVFALLQLESAIARYYYSFQSKKLLRAYISTVFWTILIISVVYTIFVVLFSKSISLLLFADANNTFIVEIASLKLPMLTLFSFFTVIIRFKKKPIAFTIFVFIQLLTTVGLSILLVVALEKGIAGVFISQIFGFLLANGLMFYYLKNEFKFIWKQKILKKLFKYALPLVPSVASGWINNYANRFFMLAYLSLTEIGIYTVALKLASIIKIIESAFMMAWGPFVWESFEKPGHQLKYRLISSISFLAMFSLLVLIVLFFEYPIKALIDKNFYQSIPFFYILCIAFIFKIFQQIVTLGQGITKKTYYNLYSNIIGLLLGLLFLVLFIQKFELYGVVFSILISNVIVFIFNWIVSENLYPIHFNYSLFMILFGLFVIIIIIASFVKLDPLVKIVIGLAFFSCIYVIYRRFIKNELKLLHQSQ